MGLLALPYPVYAHGQICMHQTYKIILGHVLPEIITNERSSADSLFRNGNAQLYLFTLNSTHFSLSSYTPDTDTISVSCQTRHGQTNEQTAEWTENYQFLILPGCEQLLRNIYWLI